MFMTGPETHKITYLIFFDDISFKENNAKSAVAPEGLLDHTIFCVYIYVFECVMFVYATPSHHKY